MNLVYFLPRGGSKAHCVQTREKVQQTKPGAGLGRRFPAGDQRSTRTAQILMPESPSRGMRIEFDDTSASKPSGAMERPMNRAPLRFAMITTFYPPYNFGGDGHAVRRLAHALARRGHQVDVIHDIDAFRALGGVAAAPSGSEPDGITVHRLESRFGALSCLATHQFGRPLVHGKAIRRILDQGFDVIHFHNVSLVGGPGVLEYGTGIKLYTAHEHWLVCPSHTLWRHNRERCDARQCLRCVAHYHRPPQLWRRSGLLERQSQHVDTFITYSKFSADKHREFGFNRVLSVMPQFILDSERSGADPAISRNPEDPQYFLFVGRLEAIKGLQDVIPLFRKEGAAELWVAGSGTYENTLRELANGAPRVRFLGQQTAAQLRDLYRGALALIVPSVCFEVFALVLIEAFCEATPVVARRVGPFPEIISQSGGGLLFDTAEELEQALAALSEKKGLREKLGGAAAHASRSLWSESAGMQRYFDLIRSVAQRRGDRQLLRRLGMHVDDRG